ncbi:hypothetical protein AWV79_16655 [Cupriavidus sp. UYMMa02A]|nr:hypothetical protein AWV79_16655 [Cupriavidus sp. UYMMa02A]
MDTTRITNRRGERFSSYSLACLAAGLLLGGCATQSAQPVQTAARPAATPMPGPQGARGTPEGCQADKLGDESLVGKTEAEAIAMLQGCAWRLGERDGQQFPGTMDYNPQRRTLGITSGKVAWVRRG